MTTGVNTQTTQHLLETLAIHPVVSVCRQIVQEKGGQLFLVGGAIRDWFLGQGLSPDLDFTVTDVSAQIISQQLAQQCAGHYVLLDAEHGIHRVVIPEHTIEGQTTPEITVDIADALGNHIETDLARRDLTVNAMALEVTHHLATPPLLDPYDGVGDLQQKQIRMVSRDNLLEDPLRLLRVFRVAATINAQTLEKNTLAIVREYHPKVLDAAPERIQVEFLKLLSAPRAFPYLQQMGDCGLLETLLPELTATRAIAANGFHHLGLYDHTLELVNQAELLLPEFPPEAKTLLEASKTPFATRAGLVKLACLFHDLGKPDTLETRPDGRFTFYGHDQRSEEMTADICRRFRLSKSVTNTLEKLVRWHLYPCHFGKDSPRRSILRFLRRIGDDVPDLILLALADRYSTRSTQVTAQMFEESVDNHWWLLAQYFQEATTFQQPPLLDGKQVISLFNLSPGPVVGQVLKALREAQQLGEVHTPEDATQWVKHFLTAQGTEAP